MPSLSRADILGRTAPAPVAVVLPEWDGATVFIRSISAGERDDYEGSMRQRAGKDYELNTRDARAKLVALCACDEQGQRLFADHDIPALTDLPAAPMDRLFEAAMKVNRLNREDVEELFQKQPNRNGVSAATSPSISA